MNSVLADNDACARHALGRETAYPTQKPHRGPLTSLAALLRRVRACNESLRELSSYSDMELAELGISRPQIGLIALGTAFGWPQVR